MSKPRLDGRKAKIEGNAFDLKKTVRALHNLVRAYIAATVDMDAVVATRYPKVPPANLPNPGFQVAEKVWSNLAGDHDVVDEPLLYIVGPVTFKAYLLGKTWSVYHPTTGDILTSQGQPADQLDATPIICVYGTQNPDGTSGLLTPAQMDTIEELLEKLGIPHELERKNVDPDRLLPVHVPSQLGYITLPHAHYGDGRRELTVRCVLPGGKEIGSVPSRNLN